MRRSLRLAGITTAGALAAAVIPFLGTSSAEADTWTGGDLVVYRVGNGTALTNAATPVFLDTFHANGTAAGTVALPTAASGANQPLTATGLSRSEGLLSTSADGRLLAVTGYAATPGTVGPNGTLTTSDRTLVPRVVGIVDSSGAVDTSTTLTGANAPTIIRSAATDGAGAWVGGDQAASTGALGGSLTASAAGVNLAGLSWQGGQLFTSGLVGHRLARLSGGSFSDLPLATGLGSTPNLPANLLAYGYAFLDLTGTGWGGTTLDTLYVADASNRGGTLDKYSFDGTDWQPKGSIDVPGIFGLVAHRNGGTVELAVTTPTQLLAKTDSAGSTTTITPGAPSVLATATTNEEFRGVALAPTGTGPVLYPQLPAAGTAYGYGASIPVAARTGGSVTSVSFTIGGTSVPGTQNGSSWTASLPTGSLTGSQAVTVSATDGTTTRTASTTVSIAGPPVPQPPAGAATAGNYSVRNAIFGKVGAWASFLTPLAPGRSGLVSAARGRIIRGTIWGTHLNLVFQRKKNAGKAYVTVDGRTALVDLYAARVKGLIRSYALAPGAHSFQIKVAGLKRSTSKGKYVYVAAVQVR